MKLRRILLATTIAGVGAVGLALPSQAQLTTFCDGVAAGLTVPGDLVVRAGDSCDLTDVVVQGNATVRAGGTLLLAGATVTGNLVVQADAFADVIDSTIDGATRLNAAYGAYSEGSDHAGPVTANDPDFFYGVGSTFAATVASTDGETFFESARLGRGLSTSGDLLTDVNDSVIEGTLSVTGSALGSVVCASEIDGAATFHQNAERVQIGPGAVAECAANVFGSDLTVTSTSGASSVSGAVVRGDLVCADNEPATVATDNRVRGEDACGEAAATSAHRQAVETADSRRVDLLADIDVRRAEGRGAAADAGPAFG